MQLKSFKGGYDSNFSYLLWKGEEGVIIDTALDPFEIFDFADENNVSIKYAFVMHSHFDHKVQLEKYREAGILLVGSPFLPFLVDQKVNDGDVLRITDTEIKIIHAPGHTPDCILLSIGKMLFTTDVLFIDGCGRCDFAGGDAGKMYDTLEMIKQLPDETVIYPGHDYGKVPFDTLGNQRLTNRFLMAKSKEDFVNERI
jgi:glyoxylase-like metal-dependent hydrolase (beta-lactamase superfamily II)